MAGKCEVCDKGPQFGHNVSHSKRRTNRMWHPNTHKTLLSVNGVPRRLTVCSRCVRTLNKRSA